MILLHDESDNVDEQAEMVRMEMAMKSVMMITLFLLVIVIAMSHVLIRGASGDGGGRCIAGESVSCTVYF